MTLNPVLLSLVVALATNVAQAYDWQPLPAKAPEPADNPMTVNNAAKAVAAFERSMITLNSPYDRFVTGERDALDGQHRVDGTLFS